MKRILFVTVLCVLGLAACGGGGGGSTQNLVSCVSISVDVCEPGSTITDVWGTVRNLCGKDLRYVKVIGRVYDNSGSILGVDEEYIEDLGAGTSKSFDALVGAVGPKCGAIVEEAVAR